MAGWDARLMGVLLRDCPYRRNDFSLSWRNGWKDCDAGKPLPWWHEHAKNTAAVGEGGQHD